MKINKIILVGYKSFLQENLYQYLKKKKLNVKKIKFKVFLKSKIKDSIIINFSNDQKFFKKKYKEIYDRNLKISKKLSGTNSILYFISTRKVYAPSLRINENSDLNPIDYYAKNNLISEKKCKQLLKKNIAILRTSNVIGYEIKKKKQSMMSMLISGILKNKIILDQTYNYKKDILPVIFFCQIVTILIKKEFRGLVNIGSGVCFSILEICSILGIKKNLLSYIFDKNKKNEKSFSYNVKKLNEITKLKISKKKIKLELIKIKDEIRKKI